MKYYGWIGLTLLAVSEYGLISEIEPFTTWFYCFAWWSYILLADNLLNVLRGRSLLQGRSREFPAMLAVSIFVWLVFEAFNFRIQNWSYIIPPMEVWQRWTGYLLSFATVLPAIFITADLVELFWSRSVSSGASECDSLPSGEKTEHITPWIVFGAGLTVAPLIWPRYFFPAVWLGPIFLFNPLLGKLGKKGLSFGFRFDYGRRIWCLMIAGLICGILWEFWNFRAGSRWIYSVPFFGQWKVFEMPLLGFLGFPPFALECWILYHLIKRILQNRKSGISRVVMWLGMAVVSGIVLFGIDAYTVSQF